MRDSKKVNVLGSVFLLAGMFLWAETILWSLAYFIMFDSAVLLSIGLWLQTEERKALQR